MCPVPSGVPFPPSAASLPLTSILTLLGIKAARVVFGWLLPSFPSVGSLIAWQKNPPDSAFCVVCWSWWGVLGGAGAASHVPRASGSCSRGAGEAASSETLPRSVCTALARGSAGHWCTVPAWPCGTACPYTQQCLWHRCESGCCRGPGAGAPHAGEQLGEPLGAGWVQGSFGDVLALFVLEGERLDAGLG